MKESDLIFAAKDLNKVVGLKPPIDTVLTEVYTVEVLENLVREGALLMIPTDQPKERTINILKQMEWSKEDFADLGDGFKARRAFRELGIFPLVQEAEEVESGKEEDTEEEEEPEVEEVETEEEESAEPVKKKEEPPPDFKEEPQKEKRASAYGTALAIMGKKPTMELHILYETMKKQGFNLQRVGNSIKTAHSIFRKCFRYLRTNGYIKESKIKD